MDEPASKQKKMIFVTDGHPHRSTVLAADEEGAKCAAFKPLTTPVRLDGLPGSVALQPAQCVEDAVALPSRIPETLDLPVPLLSRPASGKL